MKISVIVPCYNQAEYLSDNLESIQGQTEKPHEVIVVNDGSTDETRYISQQYPFTYVEQVNKGLSSARNTGIMNTTVGMDDYILPLDADDMMTDNCIKRIREVAEETGADIIAPSFKCFGKYNDQVVLMKEPTLNDFRPLPNTELPLNRIGHFSAVKKEALLEVGGYSPRMEWGWEDLHLWINLLSRGKKIVTIPEILILYRTKESSMIHEANRHATELWSQISKDFPDFRK